MGKRYTKDEKIRALDSLQVNGGDLHKTASETGVPFVTLRGWQRKLQAQQERQELEMLQKLRRRLLESAVRLADRVNETVLEAPLNQCATALSAVIDRFMKLEEFLPKNNAHEQVIRIEYLHPDGTIHSSPPWASSHHGHEGEVQSGGVWSPFWKDRNGQDAHHGMRDTARPVLVARPDLPDGESGVAGLEDGTEDRVWYDA